MTRLLDRLSLIQKLVLLLVVFGVGLTAVATISLRALNEVKIGGEMQLLIQKDNDLLADILPPPLYVVEALAVVERLKTERDPAVVEDFGKYLVKLQSDFDLRIEYWEANPHEDEENTILFGDLQNHARQFFALANGAFLDAVKRGDSEAVYKEIAELEKIYERQHDAVNRLVEVVTRNSQLFKQEAADIVKGEEQITYTVIGVAALVYCGVFFLVFSAIRRQLGGEPAEAVTVMRAIASGATNINVNVRPGDTHSLFYDMQRAAAQVVTTARLQAALNCVASNVLIADNDYNIIYINDSFTETFRSAENSIRKTMPQFEMNRLLGASMDIFHKSPGHQRNLLANLRGTHRTQVNIGELVFGLIANPVFDKQGNRLGSVLEFADRTSEVSVEREVGDIVGAAAGGDFSQRITVENKTGFFRQLADNINQLMITSETGLRDIAGVLEALARGDLTRTMNKDYSGVFDELKGHGNNTVTSLTDMLLKIREAASTIHVAASEIASGNADLSSRTEQQAANLEETASSMEELTSTVKQNADNAKQANQMALSASAVAQKGGAVVDEVVITMGAINTSARKIADIISVIDSIAFQTNILALNAAVEAARAGEQGRGFAVVAAEVRNLAQRSASAAKEIKSLITDSVDKVDNGNRLVNLAGTTMQEVVQSIKRVTDLVAEIAAASEEQSTGIEQVNGAVTQMDETTQQNAALVEQAAAAAESMREQADLLAKSVGVFVLAAGDSGGHAPRAIPKRMPSKPEYVASPAKAKLKPLKSLKVPDDDEWVEI